MTRRALGKGLAALIPDIPEEIVARGKRVVELEVAKIRANPYQPRMKFSEEGIEELKRSIVQKGVIQPIAVREARGGYQLIVGERRLRAVKAAGLETIPALVLAVSSPEEMMELGLVENLQREDLNPMDEAKAYQALTNLSALTQEQIGQKVGKDRSTVANTMRLLKLPKQVQDCLYNEALSMGHARALLAVGDPRIQLRLCRRIVKEGWSVRKVEEWVKGRGRPARRRRAVEEKPPSFVLAEEQLRGILGTRVSIEQGRKKGKIEIEFYSEDDLDRILQIVRGAGPAGMG